MLQDLIVVKLTIDRSGTNLHAKSTSPIQFCITQQQHFSIILQRVYYFRSDLRNFYIGRMTLKLHINYSH